MGYQVKPRRAVQRQLDELDEQDYEVIAEAISALEQEPRPPGVKKLAESGLWRIRVRRYRVIYSINNRERVVVIVRVARRTENTYRSL